MNKSSINLLLLVLMTSLLMARDGLAAPRGAVKLKADKLSKKTGFYCGYVNKSWIPGRLLSGRLFYSHAAERANFRSQLKSAKGKKRKNIRTKIDFLDRQISERRSLCAGSNPGGGGSGRTALRFNFTGAVGLALKPVSADASLITPRSATSNLFAVNSLGQLSSVLTSGSTTVLKFLVASKDKLYLLLSKSSDGCVLAEVNTSTGQAQCIDKTITSVVWPEAPRNPAIQFDGEGAIYYLGEEVDRTVLRKYLNGKTTDLTTDNITLADFLVHTGGSVVIYGQTKNTSSSWIRRISATGGLQTIRNIQNCNQGVTFIRAFPDGKVYFGVDDCALVLGGGIVRMAPDATELEATPWFGPSAQTPLSHVCGSEAQSGGPESTLKQCGTKVSGLLSTPSQKVFGVTSVGTMTDRQTLVQYYNAYSQPTLSIKDIKVFKTVISSMILAGLDASGRHKLVLYDIEGNSETQLIGTDQEIEIYHIGFVAAENKIMFDGLRFSDNKYVIGQVDLDTRQFVASSTGGSRLLDFQSLR